MNVALNNNNLEKKEIKIGDKIDYKIINNLDNVKKLENNLIKLDNEKKDEEDENNIIIDNNKNNFEKKK